MTTRISLLPIALALALPLTACRLVPSTPLGAAAARGDAAAVKVLLIDTPADAADNGWTPLIWAARAGQVEAMTLLLDAGADPNRRDSRHGWTPLMHAQHVRQDGAAALLLARGADGTRGAAGTSPLEMAALDNDVEMLGKLLAAGPPREQQVRAFALAVSGGALADVDRPLLGGCRTEAVAALLVFDKTLGRVNDGLGSPLWWARRQGCKGTTSLVATANSENSAQKVP